MASLFSVFRMPAVCLWSCPRHCRGHCIWQRRNVTQCDLPRYTSSATVMNAESFTALVVIFALLFRVVCVRSHNKYISDVAPRYVHNAVLIIYPLSFIHSFIYLLNKAIMKSAVKCIVEQESKAKALTTAQKLKLYKNYMSTGISLLQCRRGMKPFSFIDYRWLRYTDSSPHYCDNVCDCLGTSTQLPHCDIATSHVW